MKKFLSFRNTGEKIQNTSENKYTGMTDFNRSEGKAGIKFDAGFDYGATYLLLELVKILFNHLQVK